LDFVKKIRTEVGIPQNGIEYTEKYQKLFFVDKDLTSWFIPEELIKATKKSKARLISEINKPVIAFLEGLGIKSFYISNLLRMYVIFNATVPVVFEDMVFSDDLLSLENLSLDLCFYSKGDLASLNQLYENLEERSPKISCRLIHKSNGFKERNHGFFIKKLVGCYWK
jgi:hypothetical protein